MRPTFGGHARTIEVYVLDYDRDLYGRHVAVQFVDWLRAEERFENAEALKGAIARDVAEVRARLASLIRG
jgi:riboflavin kinase/FMN adenylyltransferase